jgi:23S rRNA pseudouridine2605 synthase
MSEKSLERLQKIIARSGLCSRREADRLIQEGRVTVNGRTAEVGERAHPATDHIRVDGKPVRAAEPHRYLLLNKPRGVLTTCDDPEERETVIDIVRPAVRERVFPVGRLDYHSEGLILLTNDGDLAARVTHPRYGVVREYLAKIRGDLTAEELQRLMRGAVIEGTRVLPIDARRESRTRAGNSWWKITVAEGRTHEVRELFFRAGHHVQRLKRTAIGPIRDTSLRPGEFRTLTESELKSLRDAAAKQVPNARSSARRRDPRKGRR